MPWVPYCKPPGETPAHYAWPKVLPDCVVLGEPEIIEYAKDRRKEISQIRESLLPVQKECGKNKDIENARFISELCADLMKQYRGWDAAIKMIEDAEFTKWPRPGIAEQIAPYVDRAFDWIDLYSARNLSVAVYD